MRKARLTGAMEIPHELLKLSSVKKELTYTYKPMGVEEALEVRAYTEMEDGYIAVPRQYGLELCNQLRIDWEDHTSQGQPIKFPKVPTPRDNQVDILDQLEDEFGEEFDVLFKAFAGWGKCQAKGTPIIMFDGSVKRVENIRVGELVMGPDSKPRRVLSLARGREEMFKVTPVKGDTYTFNRSHMLSLKRTGASVNSRKGEIVNVSIAEYLTWSKAKKHGYKLWRTGVDFPTSTEQALSPYFVGLYLGDGTKQRTVCLSIGKDRIEVLNWVARYMSSNGWTVRIREDEGYIQLYASQVPTEIREHILEDLTDFRGRRHIPREYLIADREQRLQLLAGLMDSDGHLYSNVYELAAKDREFAEQVAFLARSVGMAAYVSSMQKKAQGWTETRTYYRVKISGNTDMIPVITPSRKAEARKQRKDVMVTGFKVESVGEGDYYGFTLDGDHLYLLGDFTVTHNTIASLILSSRLGVSTLILVDQENLKDQWVERLVDPDLFGLSKDQIGTVQGKKCDYQGRLVTIAMVQTLSQKTFDQEFYDYFGFVVADECHVMGAPTFSTILMMFPATYRMYVSATPRRRDGLQKALDHNCGPIRVEAENRREESKVYILRNSTIYSWYGNISPKVGRIITEVAEDSRRNLAIAHVIVQQWESGRDVLVIGDRIEHLQALCDMVYYMGVTEEHTGMFTGYTVSMEFTKDPTPKRVPEGATYEMVDGKRVYAPYTPVNWVAKEKKVPKARYQEILDTCSIIFASYHKFSKGADLPRLSVGIDVTPRSTAEQTIGRVQRLMEGKRQPLWITPVDENNFRLMHSFAGRVQEYAKANSRIYEWDGEKETKEWKIPELLAEVRGGVNRLKQMEIRPSADGVNRLVEKAQVKKEKMASQREEAKRLFKKPASSGQARARRKR